MRITFVLLVGACYLAWYYDQQSPHVVSREAPAISARDDSIEQTALHQDAGPVELVAAEPRAWFNQIRHYSPADIARAWGWFVIILSIFVYLWLSDRPMIVTIVG